MLDIGEIDSNRSNNALKMMKFTSRSGSIIKTSSFVTYPETINFPNELMNEPPTLISTRKYSVMDPECTASTFDEYEISNSWRICTSMLVFLVYVLIFFTMPLSLIFCIKIISEYERAVIFRFGRIPKYGTKGPGIIFVLPCLEAVKRVDLRTLTFNVPSQEVLTKDSVTVAVDAVVYYRIYNPIVSIINVEDCDFSTRLLAATTLRNVLGTKDLSDILSERELISGLMQVMLDDATHPWGVKVERVEIKDVRLPLQLQRAMAAEAEATREANAKVIAAEGEQKSSIALKAASEIICQSPTALQLRYLQTLSALSSEHSSTIIFPFPMELLLKFVKNNIK